MAKNPSQAPASTVPAADTSADAAAGAPAAAPPPAAPIQTTSALVQVDVHIEATAFLAGVVVEGLPVAMAEAYRGAVDPHPDAVAHAIAAGAKVVQFAAAEAD